MPVKNNHNPVQCELIKTYTSPENKQNHHMGKTVVSPTPDGMPPLTQHAVRRVSDLGIRTVLTRMYHTMTLAHTVYITINITSWHGILPEGATER